MENIKHGLISRNVEKLDNGNYLLSDFSSGWHETIITPKQYNLFKQNKLNLLELEWY